MHRLSERVSATRSWFVVWAEMFISDQQRAVKGQTYCRRKQQVVLGCYLTCGISEQVTDVRNDFTERQTLRSKPKNTKYNMNLCAVHALIFNWLINRVTVTRLLLLRIKKQTSLLSSEAHRMFSSRTHWGLRWDKGRVLLWSCCSYAWSLPSFAPTHTEKNVIY